MFLLRFSFFLFFPLTLAGKGIDNSSLGNGAFRPHNATYGLVYVLPPEFKQKLDEKVLSPLKEKLGKLDLPQSLRQELELPNLAHATLIHIHNADPGTPKSKLLALFQKGHKWHGPVDFKMKKVTVVEATHGVGAPWWFDLGIEKQGKGFEQMQQAHNWVTALVAPMRDGPLPRCTGPVFALMNGEDKKMVQEVGVNGVYTKYRPHITLTYSNTKLDAKLKLAMDELAKELDQSLPGGIDGKFTSVSIVELGFLGNVTREIYRLDLATGKTVPLN